MSDAVRAYVTIAGGVIALAIALASSLPAPVFIFDKVVVGALLIGGLAALGVSINIGQSPEARNARAMAKMSFATPKPEPPRPTWRDFNDILRRLDDIQYGAVEDAKPKTESRKIGGTLPSADLYPLGGPVETEPVKISETKPMPATSSAEIARNMGAKEDPGF